MIHPADVRVLLNRDRPWCVYALGDMDPRRHQHCEWHVRGSSVALLYREFDVPILFAAGTPDVLDVVPDVDACLLQIPDTFRAAVEQRFAVEWLRPMRRMVLAPEAFSRPEATAVRLTVDHEDEIRALYADGAATHEEPDFFMRSQLGDGTFFGMRDGGRLVAAGGTHLYSADESVGAIGNVYTHRSYRGRGHGAAVTAAIVRELIARGTETIALNVKADNDTAVRLYERLGFRHHANFFDGRASRR
jgi:ribosomal protein S18 acetylase RimI-like enzyme